MPWARPANQLTAKQKAAVSVKKQEEKLIAKHQARRVFSMARKLAGIPKPALKLNKDHPEAPKANQAPKTNPT